MWFVGGDYLTELCNEHPMGKVSCRAIFWNSPVYTCKVWHKASKFVVMTYEGKVSWGLTAMHHPGYSSRITTLGCWAVVESMYSYECPSGVLLLLITIVMVW